MPGLVYFERKLHWSILKVNTGLWIEIINLKTEKNENSKITLVIENYFLQIVQRYLLNFFSCWHIKPSLNKNALIFICNIIFREIPIRTKLLFIGSQKLFLDIQCYHNKVKTMQWYFKIFRLLIKWVNLNFTCAI